MRLESSAAIPSGTDVQKRRIYGVVGMVELISGPYLIVVTARTEVGKLLDHSIFRVERLESVPFLRSETHLREQQALFNRQYLELLEQSLRDRCFYYSPSFDLSHSQQRLTNVGAASANQPDASGSSEWRFASQFERSERRFVWNGMLLSNLLGHLDDKASKRDVQRFFLPLICGFVAIQRCSVQSRAPGPENDAAVQSAGGKRQFDLVIISRRAVGRAGVRFFMRGADPRGEVANFVETEQIIVVDDYTFSFVQVRGSIPLFWTQRPNLRYAPPIRFVQPSVLDNDTVSSCVFDSTFNYTYSTNPVFRSVCDKVKPSKSTKS